MRKSGESSERRGQRRGADGARHAPGLQIRRHVQRGEPDEAQPLSRKREGEASSGPEGAIPFLSGGRGVLLSRNRKSYRKGRYLSYSLRLIVAKEDLSTLVCAKHGQIRLETGKSS